MRLTVLASLTLVAPALAVPAAPALAHPTTPLTPASPAAMGYASTDNVELVARFPQHTGTAGGAPSQDGTRFFLEILLVDAASTPAGPARLQVVDVSDPAKLRVLSTVPITDHTWTCVSGTDDEGQANSCAYAYGRSGHIWTPATRSPRCG